ncbi:MAG: ABC transporter permease [Bacteriovoracaceae bacterium]|nr:ABC transporter permease [Bacteriovoracaceae bacterium]
MNHHKFLIKFSWRNLGRHPLRTLIMALGLCFGTGYIIFALNFSASGSREIVSDFLAQYSGSHQIVAPDYYPDLDKKKFNPNYIINDEMVKNLDYKVYVKRITLPVFLSGPKKTLGTLLTGLEPDHELTLSKVNKALSQGHFIDKNGEFQILLGEKLARKLGLKLGDEVAIFGQALDGSVANEMFKLVGLMNFGGGEMEENLAFTDLQSSQRFAVIPEDHFHQYISFAQFGTAYPIAPEGTVLVPWDSILPEISGSIRFIDIFTWIVAVIIVVVISLGMGNTLMITFLERQKEFYSLNVIGARSSWVAISLAIEVALLGILGIGSGVILGNLVTLFFHHYPISLKLFTGGKAIMMGGMAIIPKVRLWHFHQYSWQAPLLVFVFMSLSLSLPIYRIIQRSKRAD